MSLLSDGFNSSESLLEYAQAASGHAGGGGGGHCGVQDHGHGGEGYHHDSSRHSDAVQGVAGTLVHPAGPWSSSHHGHDMEMEMEMEMEMDTMGVGAGLDMGAGVEGGHLDLESIGHEHGHGHGHRTGGQGIDSSEFDLGI